jgi:predicted transcriptional regulator
MMDSHSETPTPTPTAAELLAEWKALVASIGMTQPSEYPFIMEIAAQLDQMCENMGISIEINTITVSNSSLSIWKDAASILIDANELKTLIEWLLIKENHGK